MRKRRLYVSLYCFFFSSRRRHTRSLRDWSSDVCSSDLTPFLDWQAGRAACIHILRAYVLGAPGDWRMVATTANEIGRASCRERVLVLAVEETTTKKLV